MHGDNVFADGHGGRERLAAEFGDLGDRHHDRGARGLGLVRDRAIAAAAADSGVGAADSLHTEHERGQHQHDEPRAVGEGRDHLPVGGHQYGNHICECRPLSGEWTRS